MATIKSAIQYRYANATAAAIEAGTGVQLGTNAFGVATSTIAPGAEGILDAVGVYSLPISSSVTASAGAPAYWDAAGSKVLASGAGKLLIGVFAAACASGATSCEVAVFPTGTVNAAS